MKNDILIPLLNNAVLLLALATVYDLLTVKGQSRKRSIFGNLISGFALGFLGIGLMTASVRLVPGIVFDTRSVLLSISGLFFGPAPTIIAMGMTAAFRLAQGGAAAYAGTAVIIATGSIGLIWRRLRKKPLEQISASELYIFGIVNHVVMLALMLMLPLETALHVLSRISGPVLMIYPLATIAFGLLLAGRLRRQRTAEALVESEITYRKLFQNNHAVMLLINPENGAIVDANPAASQFYGWTVDELRGLKIFQINTLPPEKMQAEIEHVKAGRRNSFNFQHRLADGSIRDVEVLTSPVTMGEQKLLYSIIHDVTERQRQLAEAEQARYAALSIMEDAVLSKQRLEITQYALDRSADAIFWVEHDARLSYVNDSACRLLGYTKEELLKLSVPEIDKYFTVERITELFTTLDQQKTVDLESLLITKDRNAIPVDIHTSLIRFESRSFICAFVHDITKRKQMQAAIEKRIVALTRPLDQAENIAFDDLFNLAEIQRIQDEFAAATGVAASITLPNGTPITAPSNFTCLCRDIIRKTEKGCSNCFKSAAVLGRHHPEGPVVQPCMSGGLWEAGVSIMVGDRHIANWLIGQVRDETQTDAAMRVYAREIGADEQQFMDAFYNVRVMPLEHFEKIAQALFTLANQLSTSAYQNIQQARFIAEEKKDKEELNVLSAVVRQSPEAIIIRDIHGINVYVNPAYTAMTGYSADEMIGKNTSFSDRQSERPEFFENIQNTLHSGKPWSGHIKIRRKDGEVRTLEAALSPIKNRNNQITNFVGIQRDITEELAKDEQFRQSQKMDAVGQLAGGVAHDFNNILQAILGFSELLLNKLKAETVEHRNVSEIHKAAKRAAELTRQLLAFSRKQPIDKKRLNLNTAIYDMEVMIKLLLGVNLKYELSLSPDLQEVQADHGQITQIILNLAINARDAMPDGGLLTLATENKTFETKDITAEPEAQAGRFACLSIIDNGLGMNQEVKDHLFEPFFTTKMVGQGTGLGLSVVYGIVKQNKGWIHVESEEGKGTTFKIYLPLCENNAASINRSDDPIKVRKTHILLVEDDADTCNMVTRIFATAQYETIKAASAEDALQLFTQNPGQFDLLFSDISLPGATGIELADTIRSANPNLPIVLYSGYQNPREKWENLDRKGYQFIQKPFSIASLLATVHDALKDRN
jgi:PAS domain S-box-containing protein